MRVNTTNINNSVVGVFPSSDLSLNWYVVYTKPLTEKKVAERLRTLGFEVYLPLYTTVKQWSDRKKKIEKPLISSVVFVRTSPQALNQIYAALGVSRVLKHLGQPAIVQDTEINNLRILLQEAHVTELQPIAIEPGALVEVTRGPFKGLLATAVQIQNALRLIIDIKHMGIAFSVNVPKSFVKLL
jgi:transcription antitermination factor NusG